MTKFDQTSLIKVLLHINLIFFSKSIIQLSFFASIAHPTMLRSRMRILWMYNEQYMTTNVIVHSHPISVSAFVFKYLLRYCCYCCYCLLLRFLFLLVRFILFPIPYSLDHRKSHDVYKRKEPLYSL